MDFFLFYILMSLDLIYVQLLVQASIILRADYLKCVWTGIFPAALLTSEISLLKSSLLIASEGTV